MRKIKIISHKENYSERAFSGLLNKRLKSKPEVGLVGPELSIQGKGKEEEGRKEGKLQTNAPLSDIEIRFTTF